MYIILHIDLFPLLSQWNKQRRYIPLWETGKGKALPSWSNDWVLKLDNGSFLRVPGGRKIGWKRTGGSWKDVGCWGYGRCGKNGAVSQNPFCEKWRLFLGGEKGTPNIKKWHKNTLRTYLILKKSKTEWDEIWVTDKAKKNKGYYDSANTSNWYQRAIFVDNSNVVSIYVFDEEIALL